MPLLGSPGPDQGGDINDHRRSAASSELVDLEECYALLGATTVGRVAFAGPHGLVLLPVNYRVADRDVLLRTSRTGTLGDLQHHRGEVLFEVDYHAPSDQSGWSVLVRGTCTAVTDPVVMASAALRHLVPWSGGSHDLVLAIRPATVTGRSVGRHRPTGPLTRPLTGTGPAHRNGPG